MKYNLITLPSQPAQLTKYFKWFRNYVIAIILTLFMGFFLNTDKVWAASFVKLKTTGPSPTATESQGRSFPEIGVLGSYIYFFGGAHDSFATKVNTFFNDLYRLNTKTNVWEKLSPKGELPPARGFGVGVGYEPKDLFIIFGGARYDADFSNMHMFNDLWAYSPSKNTWTRIHPKSEKLPPARSEPTAWLVGNKIYVFGGVDAKFDSLNDLWAYDIDANTWTEVVPNGAPGSPSPRFVPRGGEVSYKGKLVLYSGQAFDASKQEGTYLNDVWEFDLQTNKWKEIKIPPEHNIMPPRTYPAAVIIGENMYVQGGDIIGVGTTHGCKAPFPQSVTDELWRLNLNTYVWKKIGADGDGLARIRRSVAALVDGKMYIMGGFDFQCYDDKNPDAGPGQVWNLNVYRFDPHGTYNPADSVQ